MIFGGRNIHLKPCDGLRLVALHGTGTQGGKGRIYNYFKANTNKAERAGFVKSECMNYGFGSPIARPCYLCDVDFFRGIKYSYYDELGRPHKDMTATWRELADKIAELIEQGVYLPENGGGQMNEVSEGN